MPAWAGTWKGGRYYLDADGQRVFFIERRGRSVKLATHDETIANGQLGIFLEDPWNFSVRPAERPDKPGGVYITAENLALYMEHIRKTVLDHRTARRSYLHQWSEMKLDLRTVDRKALRAALVTFTGGHNGRVEALNAFARFMVKEGELPAWNPLVSTRDAEKTRGERRAYTLEELREAYADLSGPVRDVFYLRAATGMHQTEIDQIVKVKLCAGPLPDEGVWLRQLDGKHEIKAVLQVQHKSRHRHRQSLDAQGLAAVLRLTKGVPHRVKVWKALKPDIIPSNLRHTYVTLLGECGREIEYADGGGLDMARIARAVGHRAGSTMTADRYSKLQVPPLDRIPLGF